MVAEICPSLVGKVSRANYKHVGPTENLLCHSVMNARQASRSVYLFFLFASHIRHFSPSLVLSDQNLGHDSAAFWQIIDDHR